jgi:hypothetical protein
MLSDATPSRPYPFSAVKKLRDQSRAARFNRGMACRSVSHVPSVPPARFWLAGCGTRDVDVAVTVVWFESLPSVREVIVSTVPCATARTDIEPQLMFISNAFAIVSAVSPM